MFMLMFMLMLLSQRIRSRLCKSRVVFSTVRLLSLCYYVFLAFFPRKIPLSLLDLTTPESVSLASPRLLLRRLSSLASKGQYAYGCNFSPFLRTSPPPLALYRSPVCVAEVLVVLFVLVDLLVFVVRLVLPDLRVPNVRRVAPSSSSSPSSRARLRSFSSTILSLPVDLSVLYFVPSSSASPNSFRLYCAVFAPWRE